MRTTIDFLLSAALCLAPVGAAMAGDVASGAGWSLSDEGVLTVGADYAWANPEWDYQYQTPCQDAWAANADNVKSIVVADGVETIGARAFFAVQEPCERLAP